MRYRTIAATSLLAMLLGLASCSEPVEGPDCAWLERSLPEAVDLGLPSWVTAIQGRAVVHSEGVRIYIAAAVGSDWSMWRAESRDGVSLKSMSEMDVPAARGRFAASRIDGKDHIYYVVEGTRVHLAVSADGRTWEDGGVVYRGEDFDPGSSAIMSIDVHGDSERVLLYLGTMSWLGSHFENAIWVSQSRDGIDFDRAMRVTHGSCPDGSPEDYFLGGQIHTCSNCSVALLVEHRPCHERHEPLPPVSLLASVSESGMPPFDLVPLDIAAHNVGFGFYREQVVLYDFDADEGALRFSTVEVPELDALCGERL